ncbi:MAG: PIG-L family deacetylase [Bacteroidota bacterium]
MKKTLFALFLFISSLFAQQQPNGAELQLAVNKLSVLGSVLYIAAHPDDENTALLSYFAKGKLYRTAYLSVTRGEGGQNLIGSEQGTELGMIRTQELLAARKVDGAEQFFTRAIDFGYSKTSEEALRLWNKDSVVKDIVWVIRSFRPDIIITRFSPTQGGHGHHLASAILAEEAFKLAGDSMAFTEQLKLVKPWSAKRLLFNFFRFGGNNPNPQLVQTIKVDVGEYNPLLGKSYTEIAGISRTMHKSQAMGSPQNKGSNINEFTVTAGDPATSDLFDGIDATWYRVPNGKKFVRMASDIAKKFNPAAPEKSMSALLRLYKELQKVNFDPLIDRKLEELESVIQSCAGLSIDARSNEPVFSHGDSIKVTITFLNRSSAFMSVASVFSSGLNFHQEPKQVLGYNMPFQFQFSSAIRADEPYSQPYWLRLPSKNNRYQVSDPSLIGNAENPINLSVTVTMQFDDVPVVVTVPVQYKWIDDLHGEKVRSVDIVPAISLQLPEKNIVWNDAYSKKVMVRVHAFRSNVNGKLLLRSSAGWILSPAQDFSLGHKGSELDLECIIYRNADSTSGEIIAEAVVNGEIFRSIVKQIVHDHIPPQIVMEDAKANALRFSFQKRGSTIGYIKGAGDEVPKALEQMGYMVTYVDDAELAKGDFVRYDAIVAGVRAYNTREQLRISHPLLMKYVEQGGTYLVQYQVMERGVTDDLAPYPMQLSRNRVTDETAAMIMRKADHPLLNTPNKITAKDFEGWVQERGLYFADKWDSKFEPIIACADPNEQLQEGGLLYAKYGKGQYIFTGLSFFRQLPAGVEGAYRLFANLLSAGK